MANGLSRWLVTGTFVALLIVFAAALWGTMVRPPAFEVRGVFVARPAPDLILVRHEPIGALGMGAMETMGVRVDPSMMDAIRVAPGDTVRLAVKPRDRELILLRIDRVR
jgi:Cu/Ag efflux protein CusF